MTSVLDMKRKAQHEPAAAGGGEQGGAVSPIQAAFTEYAAYLDAINEKRERLVKASRDITMNSKKVIFAVHRATSEAGLNATEKDLEALKYGHLTRVASELAGDDYYHFHRAFSPGIQEFVEAATFLHFCKHGSLLPLEELNKGLHTILDGEGHPFVVCPQDYILGLGDLTGEVMRLAVSGSSLPQTSPDSCRTFVQRLYASFCNLPQSPDIGRDFPKKTDVMLQSLQKIEHVSYALHVRGSEYPQDMLLRTLDAKDEGDIEG